MKGPIKNIMVSLDFGDSYHEVGELVISGRKIYFQYLQDFLTKKIEISPFKLPLASQIQSTNHEPFDGLPGVFNDSLPDGWGRLLLDRKLTSMGVDITDITPLDRLAYVGGTGVGALLYRPEYSRVDDIDLPDLDDMAEEMKIVFEGSGTDILDELFMLGGSSGGARPKIFVYYNPENNHIISGTKSPPIGYEPWIIKFPSISDTVDIAQIEYAYYKMALEAGLEMNPCKLFKGKSGRVYFGTKRFDRDGKKRLHMHSASGLMHDNFRMSTMDYGNLMDCAFRLEKDVNAYQKILRLATFNVYAHNRDDHSKNFSFLMDKHGSWKFAPAYDLTFSYSYHGHHSTMIAGESKNPGEKHLLELAKHFGIRKPGEIFEQVREAIIRWKENAIDAGVTKSSMNTIEKALTKVK